MSRQPRPVMPPSRPAGKSPTAQALSLLQKKLNTAEAETANLVRQLADLGFPTDSNPQSKNKDSAEPVAPFLPSTADNEALRKHYEALVGRLCRTESQLQTLKLNLCALQAERDLGREGAALAAATALNEESLMRHREAHEDEVRKLNKELVRTRTEWKEVLEQRNEADEEARRLSIALEEATTAKSELAVAYEDLMSSKQKINKRNSELREELAREGSLRRSLEDSHGALLERVREMEELVESERQEVQILSSDCSELREEGARIQKERRSQASQQARLEETVRTLRGDLGAKEVQLAEIREENQVLLSTLNGIKRENVALRNEMQNSRAASHSTEAQVQQFEEERSALYSALTQALSASTSPQGLQQIAKISEPGSVALKVTDSLRRLEAERTRLQSLLSEEKKQKESAERISSELRDSLRIADERYQDATQQHQSHVQSLENAIDDLKQELAALQHRNQDALKAKEHLLQEVNLAVDGMSDETARLHQELAQSKLEVTSLGHDKQYLTEENRRLMERITALEQQQDAQEKVQSTIAELLESKNRLAYDKGRLQSRVDQLQKELEGLANARTDGLQLQKVNVAMQAQYTKTTSELSSVKVTMQRLESKLRQEQELSSRKEKDFTLAIQARDEAFQECERLKGQLQVMDDREKQKAASFQRSLADAKTDQSKIAATLEGVMASHTQLQTAVESLQVELGRKDSELSSLRTERQSRQKTMESLQREVQKLTEKLVTVETLEGTQLDGLRSDLDRALAEKSKLGKTVDELLQANGKLQATTERIQNQLEKRNHKYKLLQDTREREKSDLQDQLQASRDQLLALQQQLASRRDASLKNATQELDQLQRAHQQLTDRLREQTGTNAELRAKAAGLEETCNRQRDRIRSLKAQLESCSQLRKTNAEMTVKIKDISQQLSEMEAAKRDYTRKNSEQAKTIANFVQQVAGLQADLQALSKAQDSLSSSTRKKDRQAEKERNQLQHQARDLQEALARMQEEKRDAEEKLLEASNESMQITANLQEAHSWFKARHDALQQELTEARQRQTQLERNNAEQQQQLLQEASRQALSHLARQAEADHQKTKLQMTSMVKRLQAEKDHSTFTDNKLQKFMDISGQYIEELAMELDRHRSSQDDDTT
ncbi:coiled-coil domain-containing protein 150-like [Acanthaster planci]|uniref:Coiled-coil domain-containing protein 150-like n=1 Tax=Acanthaster planci TaxID=133434 RepID=A0A8B7Z9R8_ACAPL|nr:coiled-coil domain-containing protein 150-like [Acanthaster planci]